MITYMSAVPAPRFPLRRSAVISIALLVGAISLLFGAALLSRFYWDYWFMPKEKAIDGYNVFPELRYVFFDSTAFIWCVVGLICSVALFRGALSPEGPSKKGKQLVLLYVALLGVLFVGGTVMLVVRARGY